MTAVENRGVTVDWCPFCQAIWFDSRELERTLTDGRALASDHPGFEPSIPTRGQSAMSCTRIDAFKLWAGRD